MAEGPSVVSSKQQRSRRRKLKTELSAALPALSAAQLAELVPGKEELNVVRVYAHKGDPVTLYVLHKNPVFFEVDKQIYPTVYTLWRYPDLLPAFTTWPAVLQKLAGGADLMLPGVVLPPGGLPQVRQGDRCAVTVVRNRAPVAVGTATLSTAEMLGAGMKGKGVSVLHTYMDQLWAFGDKSAPPSLPPLTAEPSGSGGFSADSEEEEEEEEREGDVEDARPGAEQEGDTDAPCHALQELWLSESQGGEGQERQGDVGREEEEEEEEDAKSPQEQMDALLLRCFLHALKSTVRKSELPLLTSSFLRNHMFPCCPSGKQIDIKKSSYKKLSRFLQCMEQQRGFVQVKELSRGVESIVDVNWKHPELRSFSVPEDGVSGDSLAPESCADARPYQPPEITALYSVSTRLQPLFADANLRKGAALSATEVRTILTDYVKRNELVDERNKNYVTVDPALCDCLLDRAEYQEVARLQWDDLFSRCLDRMQHCHQLLFPGQEPILKKGHPEPIDISVASRGSNKKVTLIKNLELYGLDPHTVASALQRRVQASSAINPLPGAKDRVQVQIQGNQVTHVGKLLLDEFRIPRKHIQGLEKAQKPGKKK
ncbi:eukaryotic translation initiation factor 2D isoform X2 [Amia ocellicauda]|uniref:eukaryotic translation initiation factor 2D isoform X2 n=1 Tax=Amia ocellicauda TaxID=2972642 RepID=UPI003464E5CB